jgi:catechol 2,3-dioxygenase
MQKMLEIISQYMEMVPSELVGNAMDRNTTIATPARGLHHTGDTMTESEFHPDVRIGHVHLRVGDLARATAFYRDVLGFDVMAYGPDLGLPGAAFLSSRGYHHHVGLNTWESEGGTPPPEGHTGLYHFALLYPDRQELGRAVRQILARGYPIDSAEDHGATVSVYLRDPDGNGIELYYDRPRSEWLDAQGNPVLKAETFDPAELLADQNSPG